MRVRISTSSMLRDVLRAVGTMLAVCGGAAAAFALWIRAEANWYQAVQSAEFDIPAVSAPVVPAAVPVEPRPFVQPVFRWRDPAVMARIEIPRLNLRVVVGEGVEEATLRRAAGHIPGTAMPGERGNFAVAGHRDSFFRGLRNVAPGDQILVRTRATVFRYDVESLMVVEPNHSAVLRSGKEAVCTLVTCYPFDYVGAAPRRWIVRARLVADSALDTDPR